MGQMVEDVKLALEGSGRGPFLRKAGRDYSHPPGTFKSDRQPVLSEEIGISDDEKGIFQTQDLLKRRLFIIVPGAATASHRLIGEVIDEMDLQERIIGVPPAGCAVLAYNYFDIDMGEAAHGRAAALATGLKRALPDRVVFTYQGDGDIAAIGTAETIHAASRGENVHDDLCQQWGLRNDGRADGSHDDSWDRTQPPLPEGGRRRGMVIRSISAKCWPLQREAPISKGRPSTALPIS